MSGTEAKIRFHELLNQWQKALKAQKTLEEELVKEMIDAYGDGTRVFLCGDSIFRGFALGTFDLPVDDPLKTINHPDLLYNLIAQENEVAATALYVQNSVNTIYSVLHRHARKGDWFVFQDAGLHSGNSAAQHHYISFASYLATSVKETNGLILTNFSCPPAADIYRHDCSTSTSWSMNDVTRKALVSGRENHGCDLLDMEAILCQLRPIAMNEVGLDIVRSDGIHLNFLGNLILALALCIKTGISITKTEQLIELYRKNWQLIAQTTEFDQRFIERLCQNLVQESVLSASQLVTI